MTVVLPEPLRPCRKMDLQAGAECAISAIWQYEPTNFNASQVSESYTASQHHQVSVRIIWQCI